MILSFFCCCREYEAEVRIVAKAFIKLGLQRYHSVCILGFNSPQWFIADIAAIYAGYFIVYFYCKTKFYLYLIFTWCN